ncbi:uncharacterized protein LOC113312225 [Papaver somniferum]|uniref:uncharacterized protein LOC113312225 n=1 Tax=Papaver somniferum TaxID=3469 RepID=UPI000E701060|nr:uncharacterized protein LOC113312225 [Papaver somniferum]
MYANGTCTLYRLLAMSVNNTQSVAIKQDANDVWDPESTNVFCDECIREVETGHRPGTHFTKVGWDNVVNKFNRAARKNYTKVQLKNKWDALKVDWNFMETIDCRRTTPEEIVAMFLHTLGHGNVNRLTQERFQHSGEALSRYFSMMLDVVCRLAVDIIKPADPTFRDTPKEISRDTRYMPHFKDCIGAIDGVHVPATIFPENQVPYIGRKGIPTQNVMAACNFDMQFIFVCAGWEGSAHDARILASVLANPSMKFPKPPKGKYNVVDAGYAQMDGYLGPYLSNQERE